MPPDLTLPERLRVETREHHARAERSGVMHLLLAGRLDRPRYCRLLRALHALYGALEAGLVLHGQHPLIAPIISPALGRTAALASDLQALHGPRWASEVAVAHAASRYARRLRLLARWRPPLLAAHAYVRYLGDLHGGQVLRERVGRAFGAVPAEPAEPTDGGGGAQAAACGGCGSAGGGGDGVAFYAFGDRSATQDLISRFRQGLLEIERRAPSLSALLVQEAQSAFMRHQRLFEEIEAAPAMTSA
jgi:heme oxygenase